MAKEKSILKEGKHSPQVIDLAGAKMGEEPGAVAKEGKGSSIKKAKEIEAVGEVSTRAPISAVSSRVRTTGLQRNLPFCLF